MPVSFNEARWGPEECFGCVSRHGRRVRPPDSRITCPGIQGTPVFFFNELSAFRDATALRWKT